MQDWEKQQNKTERRHCSRIGLILVWVFAAAMLWSMLLSAVEHFLLRTPLSDAAFAILSAANYLVTIPIAALIVRKVPKTNLCQRPLSVQRFFQWFAIGVGMMWVGSIIGMVVNDFAYAAVGQPSYDLLSEQLGGLPVAAVLFLVCVVAPVAEEILFRGLIAGRLARYGERRAVLVSALLFGLFHGNFSQFFYAFGLGALLAYAYFRTGKLRVPIALHFAFNLFGGGLSPLLMGNETLMLTYSVSMILLTVAGAVFAARVLRRLVFTPAVVAVPLRVIFVNIGMILGVLICIAQFVMIIMLPMLGGGTGF